MNTESAWNQYTQADEQQIESLSKAYCGFLDQSKTERETVHSCVEMAKACAFSDMASHDQLTPGARVYSTFMDKSAVFFILGRRAPSEGMRILGAHIDSPRIDVKPNPLFEQDGFAYLDTHYYGYIKKYQWVAMPLALHGVIAKKDGTILKVNIGEADDDPVLVISDLLPHLADKQMKLDAANLVEGEALNLLVGNRPLEGETNEAVKARILSILTQKYNVSEDDFLSSELEIVPAGKARSMGLDQSMILGYGHDDRCCAYPAMQALLDYEGIPEYTLCCVLADKEETGSVGATGMRSRYFENIVAEFLSRTDEYSEMNLRRMLSRSKMLSSDVSAGYDPAFDSVFEKKNTAFLGRGVCFNKYTGSGGKFGTSDANAEYIAWLRNVMDDANVNFQFTEMGRVDAGGGGTIAYLCAKYGMDVIDCGLAVLSMHAPWEVISKADLYETYKCYCAFIRGGSGEYPNPS